MKNQVSSPLYKKIRPDIAVSEGGKENFKHIYNNRKRLVCQAFEVWRGVKNVHTR